MECVIKIKTKMKKKKAEILLKYLAMIYQISILSKRWLQSIKIYKTITFHMKINAF
jgi:hypothetical protein